MGEWKHRLLSKDFEAKTGICACCGPVRIRVKGNTWRCQRAVNEHRGPQRQPHGLSLEEARAYTAGKCCEICGTAEKLVVDHCHKDRKIRGVLCNNCNGGIGMLQDNPDLLEKAIRYLTDR